MATPFLDTPTDRTPYGACAWLGVIVAALFLASAWGLWHAAGYLKRNGTLQLPSFSTGASTDSSNLLRQVQDATSGGIQDAAQQAAASAQQKAEEAAKQEAERQLDAQKQQLQDQASEAVQNQLQNYLSQ